MITCISTHGTYLVCNCNKNTHRQTSSYHLPYIREYSSTRYQYTAVIEAILSTWGQYVGTSLVGRTHIIVRLQTRIRRKDGTENFGGFVYVLEGFPQREFVLWVFMCPINFSVSFSGSTTARATTPHRSLSGYHAEGYHARTYAIKLTGYHVCRVTTPELPRSKQSSGYRQVTTPAGSF